MRLSYRTLKKNDRKKKNQPTPFLISKKVRLFGVQIQLDSKTIYNSASKLKATKLKNLVSQQSLQRTWIT